MTTARRIITLVALSALAVVAAPTAGAQTPTVTSVVGSADGLFVDLVVTLGLGMPVDAEFGPTPSVTLPSEGGSVSDEVLNVDEDFGAISFTAAVLTAAAEGALGPDGFATAESTVADIGLVEPIIPREPILAAELISATCSADLGGVTGATTLVGATIFGQSLDVEPEPNTEFTIAVDGAQVGVTLNRQVENPDGSLSVTALVLDIDIDATGFDVTGTLEIGPATCGVVEGEVPAPAPAPAPAPVTAQVRFTG